MAMGRIFFHEKDPVGIQITPSHFRFRLLYTPWPLISESSRSIWMYACESKGIESINVLRLATG